MVVIIIIIRKNNNEKENLNETVTETDTKII